MNVKIALACVLASLCLALPFSTDALLAQGRSLELLDRLQKGNWELRRHDVPNVPRHMCLGNPDKFIQLRHPGQNCSRIIVEDTPHQVVVQYTCPGQGYGRTLIRRESDSLIQVDTQGIANGLPFAFAFEARRVGSCRN